MLALLGALIAAAVIAPAVVMASAPARAAQRVGVYERVIVTAAGPHRQVAAGYLAPIGWSWVDGRRSGAYLAADRVATIAVALRTGIQDPSALVREGLPLGAASLPAETDRLPGGLVVTRVDSDLAAGDGLTVQATVCTPGAAASCLLVRATVGAGDPTARNRAERDLHALLESVEIIG